MVSSKFSERQYEYAMTKQLESQMSRLSGGSLSYIPNFPTQNEESKAGYDVELGALLIQYKTCSHMVGHRTYEYDKSDPNKLNNLEFYRFDLKTSSTQNEWAQHKILSHVGSKGVNTLYVVPGFHSENEFNQYYRNRDIMSNSVMFDCGTCPPLSNQEDHTVCFYPNPSVGYVFSQEQATMDVLDEGVQPELLFEEGYTYDSLESAIDDFEELKMEIYDRLPGEAEYSPNPNIRDESPGTWILEQMRFFSSLTGGKLQFFVK